MKPRTLPQLELTALHVGTKLAQYVLQVLNEVIFNDVILWTDNEAALQWVKNNNSSIVYVLNRVADIKEISNNYKFNHVPTKDNPADLLTGGISLLDLADNDVCFHGPS